MTNETGHTSYDPAFFEFLFEVEDKHFWFGSRNRIIAAQVNRLTAELPPSFRVLEVGCGTGNILAYWTRPARTAWLLAWISLQKA